MSVDQLLFKRKATITIDTLEIPCAVGGFDVAFDVEKRHDGKPNTATLKIWNLNPDHRGEILSKAAAAKKKKVLVQIEAGYDGPSGVSRIFRGDMRLAFHERNGPDIITNVEAGDGEFSISRAKISKSWGPGTPVATVLSDIVGELGEGQGNLAQASIAQFLGGGAAFVGGTACSGKAVHELTRITRSLGLEWSIQDGTLQFLSTGKALESAAVLVSDTTGMVGSPNLDHKGRLNVRTLMIPDVFPGRKIELDAAELQGFYRVEACKYTGDTAGTDWYIDLDAVRL